MQNYPTKLCNGRLDIILINSSEKEKSQGSFEDSWLKNPDVIPTREILKSINADSIKPQIH